jgi:dUTP pyrophosphatase
VVHHINEKKLDNRLDNLQIMTKSDHTKLHNIINPIKQNLETGQFIKGKIKGHKIYRKKSLDAGQDIFSNEDCVIKAKESQLISTGTFLEIPHNCVGLIWSRSGLSVKNKIEVGAGCIDENYRGEIKIHLYNFGDNNFQINKGDRIAQLLTIPINLENYELSHNLSSTDRGVDGFGSSGK